MKTLNIISIGLACTFALACTVEKPENPVAETPAGYIVLKASAPSTKTVLDGVAVNWTSSDAIVVNGNTSTAITVGSDASSADFTIPATEAPFYAISPASAYVDGSFNLSTGVLGSVTLPATQTYVAGSYDPAVAVMTGYQASETAGIAFEHAMAYLRFVVEGTTDTDAIKSLAVTSGAEPLCGTFTLNSSGISVANPGTTVTMDCGEGVAQGNPIIVAIPAGTYSKGLTVTAVDVNGHSATVVSSKSFTAAEGTIYPTTIPFVPGSSDDAIMNADQWAAFAKQVADGDDFAGKTVKIGADITVDGYFEYANGTFNGTLEGNNHVMTANGNQWPLFATIGENGKVQNLTVGGSFAAMANPGVAGNATIAKVNKGTIYKCTSTSTVNLTLSTSGCVFGAICGQNGGVVEECVNKGDITIDFAITANGALYGGGISAIGHTVNGNSTATLLDNEGCVAGKFINCTNEGNISVTVTGNKKPTKNGIGGICGLVYMNGTSFDGCVNKGDISRISDGEASNNGCSSLGGILGRAAAWYTTGSGDSAALDNGDKNGFATTYTNCSNSGAILCKVRHNACIKSATESGARVDGVGGIVGAAIGKGTNVQTITGCSNTGTLSAGWSHDTNNSVLGGIVGLARVAEIKDCSVNASFKALGTSGPIGAAGGFVGFVKDNVNVSGNSVAKSDMDLYVRTTSNPVYNVMYCGLAFGNVATSATISAKVSGSIKVDGSDLGVSSDNYLEYIVSSGSNFTPSLDNVLWAE
ncbi:MAG: hypothetical protein IJM35_00295 [Bacteroidales bacterium]|nr:hypothetical protein [Bacteroidales bacterium]